MNFFRGIFWGTLFALPIWMAIFAGCESISLNDKDLADYIPDTQPDTQPAPLPASDDIDIASIRWLGTSYKNAQRDGSVIRSASISDTKTYQDYTLDGWKVGGEEPTLVQAIGCIFYERNGVTGGKWEWMRKGVQPVKLTDNLKDGYNGHTMPAKGTKCWIMLVSIDGRYRTNIKEMNWE